MSADILACLSRNAKDACRWNDPSRKGIISNDPRREHGKHGDDNERDARTIGKLFLALDYQQVHQQEERKQNWRTLYLHRQPQCRSACGVEPPVAAFHGSIQRRHEEHNQEGEEYLHSSAVFRHQGSGMKEK